MKKSEILSLNSVLNGLDGAYSVKFKYAIKKNKDVLKPEIDALEEANKTNVEKFEEYEEKFLELLKKNTSSNDDPAIMAATKLGMVKIKKDKIDSFSEESQKLDQEYEDAINARVNEVEDYKKILDEDVDINLYMVSSKYIPEDLTQEQFEIIFPIIKDE